MNAVVTATPPAYADVRYEDNTYLDRPLRNFVRALYGRESVPVVVAYGDLDSTRSPSPLCETALSDGRRVRACNDNHRFDAGPSAIYLVAERPEA
jgi:hypothetical protein